MHSSLFVQTCQPGDTHALVSYRYVVQADPGLNFPFRISHQVPPCIRYAFTTHVLYLNPTTADSRTFWSIYMLTANLKFELAWERRELVGVVNPIRHA